VSIRKRVLLYGATVLLLFWFLGPILWLVSASFQLDNELFSVPPHWIPHNPTLDNYTFLITREPPPVYRGAEMGHRASGEALSAIPALQNSLVVAGSVMVLNLALSALAAYPFSRLRFTGKDFILGFIVTSRLIPAIAVAIPFFAIVQRLGLLDTKLALILVYLAFTLPFTIWFLIKYFDFVPPEIEEAAMVDGCTRLQALLRIVLPLSLPGLAATGAFAFMLAYSEFLFAVLLTRTMASKTVPVVLSAAAINFDVSYALASTAVVIAILPPIALALLFRNYVLRGLSTAFGQ
jgi:multiple sugar transport system permease protein